MEKTTNSDQETKQLGAQLASGLRGGDIVCLYGNLGAGKTTLVKGIAEGLGIKEDITSPTFILMNTIQIPDSRFQIQKLIHIDTYRLKNNQELLDIGVEDYLGQPDTITIIEWPEKIEELLRGKKVVRITIEHEEKWGRKIIINQ